MTRTVFGVMVCVVGSGLLHAGDRDVTPGRTHGPIIVRERHGRNVTSTNWSGYAVTGANGSVTDASGSWIVPQTVSCGSTDQYAAFWVGIDGYSSNTVEQIGTESDCQNGKAVYYAWFEMYPHPSFSINTVTIEPGDTISANVSYSGGNFTLTLTDVTSGKTFSTSSKAASAKRSSAEWIAEAPSGGGVLPLTDFGTVQFGDQLTFVSGTCDATLGGKTQPIGAFSNNYDITMQSSSGTLEAQPSPLDNQSSFTITAIR